MNDQLNKIAREPPGLPQPSMLPTTCARGSFPRILGRGGCSVQGIYSYRTK